MAGLNTRFNTLRSMPELAGYSDAQLRFLMSNMDEIVVPERYPLATAGRYCSHFMVVIEGRLKARSAMTGQRVVDAGQSVGWRPMWERALNEETVVSESKTRLLVMGHAQFRAVKGLATPAVAV